jgi:ADP-ribose pyrophosphatase YjhB (NUDIX family)
MALHHRLVGLAAGVYWRLFRPRTLGVCAVVQDPGGRVVLVRQTYRSGWHFPGGGVRKFETFTDALARELKEEIGLTSYSVERLLGVYENRSEGKDDRVVVFHLTVTAEEAAEARRADPFEIGEMCWFAPNDLPADVTPATARRIRDLSSKAACFGAW